jgi:hypothetical protein
MSSMRSVSPRTRLIAVITLALQFIMPGAAAIADVRLDAASESAKPHVESHTTQACAVLHPDNCALCRFLSTAQALASREEMPLPDATTPTAPTPEHCIRLTRAGPRTPPARAPPRLA